MNLEVEFLIFNKRENLFVFSVKDLALLQLVLVLFGLVLVPDVMELLVFKVLHHVQVVKVYADYILVLLLGRFQVQGERNLHNQLVGLVVQEVYLQVDDVDVEMLLLQTDFVRNLLRSVVRLNVVVDLHLNLVVH